MTAVLATTVTAQYRTLSRLEEQVCLEEEILLVKVSVNENFSTLLDFVFLGFLAVVGPKFYFGRKRKSESAF